MIYNIYSDFTDVILGSLGPAGLKGSQIFSSPCWRHSPSTNFIKARFQKLLLELCIGKQADYHGGQLPICFAWGLKKKRQKHIGMSFTTAVFSLAQTIYIAR